MPPDVSMREHGYRDGRMNMGTQATIHTVL